MLQTKNLKGFYFFLLLIVSLAAIALLYTKSNLSLEPAKIIKPLPIKPPQSIVLRDKTLQWGLLTSHQQTSEMLTSIEQLIGGGICAFDFNNDGWQDLFIIGGSGEHRFYGRQTWWKNKVAQSNSLWLNNEGQSFVDQTSTSNLVTQPYPMGCATGDLDNDGDEDLIVTNIGRNQIFENLGNGTFRERTSSSGFENLIDWSTSATLADFDNDGLLDIYITNFIDYQQGKKVFEQVSGFVGNINDSLNPILYDSKSNYLLRNTGNFQFEEVAASEGVQDKSGRGLAAHWIDINQDNYADLIVVNSAGTPQRLYINQRPAKQQFTESAGHYNLSHSDGSHSIAIADTNLDGKPNILLSSPSGFPPKLFGVSRNSHLEKHWYESGWESGIANNRLLYMYGWGAVLTDLNNDMYPDLFIGNGAATIDNDAQSQTVGQPNQLWINQRGQFLSSPLLKSGTSPTRGVIHLDVNNDGRMDIVTTQNNDFVRLFVNDSSIDNSWVDLELKHPQKLSSGAKVTLTFQTDDLDTIQKITTTVYQSSGFLSQSTSRLHFALPQKVQTVDVDVTWSDSSTSQYSDLVVNNIWQLESTEEVTSIKKGSPNQSSSLNKHNPGNTELLTKLSADEQSQLIQSIGDALTTPTEIKPETLALFLKIYESTFSLTDNDAQSRKNIILALSFTEHLPDSLSLKVIENALNSPDASIRIAAIEALKRQEHEISIHMLINMMKDSSPAVRCEVAKTFEHFFHEEEAVVRRKGLAISPLILMLSDSVESVAVCAISALGEAENYRAVAPLIKLANQPFLDQSTTIAAIRALGLIRDTEAIPALIEILKTRAPAKIKATTMIALQRLGYEETQSTLEQLLTFDHKSVESLNVALALLQNNQIDNLVLKPEFILRPLEPALGQLKKMQLASETQIIAALDLLALSNEESKIAVLEKYLHHRNANISDTAAIHLASLIPINSDTRQWRFFDRTIGTQKQIIQALIKRQYVFSTQELSEILKNEETSKVLYQSLTSYQYPQYLTLLKRFPKKLTASEYQQWLALCDYQLELDGAINLSWLDNETSSNETLKCWLKTQPDIETSPSLKFLQALFDSIQGSEKAPDDALTTVIASIAHHPTYESEKLLADMIKSAASLTTRKKALAIGLAFEKPYALDLAILYAQADISNPMTVFSQAQVISALPTKVQIPKFYEYLTNRAYEVEKPFIERWPAIYRLIQDEQATLESLLL
tara:strand:+ start:2210 stop:5878 length:3669 start_codon:yes stop_codon:yes gene_type:complete